MLIDSHSHIQLKGYKDDREEVMLRCAERNVGMIAVATQKDTSKKAVKIAEENDNIYATIGLHPNHLFPMEIHGDDYDFVAKAEDFDEEFYESLVKSPKVIGIGECGIDLFHLPEDIEKEVVLKKQKEVLLRQIKFAQKHELPVVIHTRDSKKGSDNSLDTTAHEEVIKIIKEMASEPAHTLGASVCPENSELRTPVRGTIHCFTSDWKTAQKYLDLGFYLGFTGIITFPARKTDPKPQEDLTEVVKKCPLNKILVETDAPYLAPQKYRGKKCEPWMVEEVVKEIAKIKQIDYKTVENQIILNTKELFTKMN